MKEKALSMLASVGEQVETYKPLLESTGYVIGKVEVSLLLGIIPSITPYLAKVGNPNVELLLRFLKERSSEARNLVKDYDTLLSQLELINQQIQQIANTAHQDAGTAVASLMDKPDYRSLVKQFVEILSQSVNNKLLAKLLALLASSMGDQSITIKGYEVQEFSVDLGILPAVSFALVRK